MGKRLDHSKVTRAKAKRALETDERNTSALSDRELLESAYKEAFRQDYHATKHSLTRGRRKIAAEERQKRERKRAQKRYEREQESVDAWLENFRGRTPPKGT